VKPIDSALLSELYGKDLVVFGTGRAGKVVIPYLAQDPAIQLWGVTNSRVSIDDAGLFPCTLLPIRSIATWAKLLPNVTMLITALNPIDQRQMISACKDVGIENTIIINRDLIDAIAHAQIQGYSIQEDYLYNCEVWSNPHASYLTSIMCYANELQELHKAAFSEFKDCHRGQSVAVVATGPSLSYYKQLSGVPHIGVNSAYMANNVSLDYYFLGHYVREWCDGLKNYDCIKFFARHKAGEFFDEFPRYFIEENHGRQYYLQWPSRMIHQNIEHHPLMSFSSIVFSAIHFAIHTRPKRIFLVGCDCSDNGHFDIQNSDAFAWVGKNGSANYDMTATSSIWKDGYGRLKRFLEWHYPDIEIVSVNPVGLKGMFHDVYTESYIEAHPEVNQSEVEILERANYEESVVI